MPLPRPRRRCVLAWPGLTHLVLSAGCSAALAPRPSPEGLAGLTAPPLEAAAGPAAWLVFLAGLGLGAAGAWAGSCWWRRRVLGGAKRPPAGNALPGDLRRLRGVLAQLEELLLEWQGRLCGPQKPQAKPKRGSG